MILANGYYQLPPGKLANAVTWLELRDLAPQPVPAPEGFELRRLNAAEVFLHRSIYRTIGEPWLWSGLLQKSEAEMVDYLSDPLVQSYVVFDKDQPIGLLDLESDPEDGMEIVYLGVLPAYTGQGRGYWLMREAIRIARETGEQRLWLHTCNFDHPTALAFYQKQGFTIYAQGFEIMDDPRHDGLMPKASAPHVPFLRHR